jgi:hypothetical protein
MTLVFHSQLILNKGETLTCIYKLVRGTAAVLDAQGNPALLLRPPAYLNLPEVIYEAPAGKTVRAEGRCEVLKVGVKETHKRTIRALKETGLRKSSFPVFEAVPSAVFYSLMHYATTENIEKGRFAPTAKDRIYLIIAGTVFVCKDGRTKLLRLEQGETLMVYDGDTSLFAEGDHTRVAMVSAGTTELLLAEHFQKVKRHGESQRELLSSYETRNARLTGDLKRGNSGVERHEGEFTNKIVARVERFEQYKRARSCFSVCRLDRAEILRNNEQKYLELVDQNRKRFGQERIYKKQIEAGRQAHALRHGKSMSQGLQSESFDDKGHSLSQYAHAHSRSHNENDFALCEAFSMKSHYAALKHHPELRKPRKEGLIRRTATLKQAFVSQHGSRASSRNKPAP